MDGASQIKLHPARITQIKALAAKDGLTSTELVERLIVEKIVAGGIPDRLDGLEATWTKLRVTISIGGVTLPAILPAQAVEIARRIAPFVAGNSDSPGFAVEIKGGATLIFGRRGRGFVMVAKSGNGDEGRMTMSRLMACDVARHIERAAIEAMITR